MSRFKNQRNTLLPVDLANGDALSVAPHGEFEVDRPTELSSRFRALKRKGIVVPICEATQEKPQEEPQVAPQIAPAPVVEIPFVPPVPPEPVVDLEVEPDVDLVPDPEPPTVLSDDLGQLETDSGATFSDAQDGQEVDATDDSEDEPSDGTEHEPEETVATTRSSRRKKRSKRS